MRNTDKQGGNRSGRVPGKRYDPGGKRTSRRKTQTEESDKERSPKPFRKYREKPVSSEPSEKRRFHKNQEENYREKPQKTESSGSFKKSFKSRSEEAPGSYKPQRKPFRRKDHDEGEDRPFGREQTKRTFKQGFREKNAPRNDKPVSRNSKRKPSDDGLTRLNKYIANAGICSRREADELIQAGVIKVNGKVVTELGFKVGPDDKVLYEDQLIRSERLVYVLLNKPKGYITTVDDPYDRKTVMALVENACRERIYPVGRLDRNTSGLLLLTNDGDLAKKLTHPKHNIRKVYHVELDKALTKADMLRIAGGIELEDGLAQVDEIAYAEGGSKKEIGIELHSGKNRIVRRIFESLGYEVMKLDRVIFAGLTKKDLPRGHWRMLTDKEVNFLKMIR